MDKENKEFYKNLKNLLAETSSWPSEYIYKFIYKSNENNVKILINGSELFVKLLITIIIN